MKKIYAKKLFQNGRAMILSYAQINRKKIFKTPNTVGNHRNRNKYK